MAQEPLNLVLEQLRQLRTQNDRILDALRVMHEDAMIMRLRVQANTQDLDSQRDALARIGLRLDRVERRLEFADPNGPTGLSEPSDKY